LIPIGDNPAPAQCRRWLRDVCRWLGPGFHPDTRGEDYVVRQAASTELHPLLSAADLTRYNDGLAACFRALGDQVYEIGLKEQRRMLKAGIDPAPGSDPS